MNQPKRPQRPPRWQIVFALTCVAMMFGCFAIAMNFEYIHGFYVKGPFLFSGVACFFSAMYYPFKSMDDHRANNPDDPDGGVG